MGKCNVRDIVGILLGLHWLNVSFEMADGVRRGGTICFGEGEKSTLLECSSWPYGILKAIHFHTLPITELLPSASADKLNISDEPV